VLVSELEAGWYRYVSSWRLHADGTIRPFRLRGRGQLVRLQHASPPRLLAFGFDIRGTGDQVVGEHNDPPLPARTPAGAGSDTRSGASGARKRRWRLRNLTTGQGYVLVPGAEDGEADRPARGPAYGILRRSSHLRTLRIGYGWMIPVHRNIGFQTR